MLIIVLDPAGFKSNLLIPAMSLQTEDQPAQNVTFRLLAVEAYSNSTTLNLAQHLIKNLRLFSNWQNGTTSAGYQHISHIQLLSNINYGEIDPECQPYYKGNATKANIINEITTFLNQTSTEDNDTLSVQVFYYAGYSNKAVTQGNTSYYMALDEPLFDWELDQTLPSHQDQKSTTIIILDTSYSGGYISKLASPGRVILAASNPDENPVVGWFTGHEDASYSNGTKFGQLGIVGGIKAADDINNDGWLSADEIFRFASQTLTHFASNQTNAETSMPYSLHPWASYGAAGGGTPLVQYNQSKPFPGNPAACIPRAILSASSRYDWEQLESPMYRQSLSRTGFAPTVGPEKPDVLWVSALNHSVTSSATVADGTVFVGTAGGTFYALDMKTGKVVWVFDAGSAVSSSPAVKDGIVIFGTEKPGKIFALDTYTGGVRWIYEVPSGADVRSSPAIVDGRAYIGCSDGYLRCFDQFSGELLWATHLGGGRLSSPAIADGMIFISGVQVYSMDMLNGALIWRYQTAWPVLSSPAVADGLVIVGTENDDKVLALEQNTGNLVWSFWTAGWLTSSAINSYKNLVIVGCRDARIYCLNRHTGFPRWQLITAPNHLSAPTISKNGLVYIGTSNGNLYCLNEETGQEVWKYAVGSPIVSSPTVAYEHVIVASQEGKIYCLGPPFPIHNIAVSSATASSPKLKPGESLEISFTVENYGNAEEAVMLVIGQNSSAVWMAPQYLEPFTIHSQNITLSPGADYTFTYSWNTSYAHLGLNSISIQAQLVLDEIEASDNTFIIDAVMIVALGDLDANGQINIIDISIAAKAYGSVPGDHNWNPDADLNNDNIINILDLSLIAKEYGKAYA